MSCTKISALPGASTLDGTETIPLVQGGTTKKVTTDQFLIKDASGNVGVGTASPVTKLEVSSATTTQVRVNMTGQADVRLVSDTGYGALSVEGNMPLLFRTNATERARIDASGNLGLGVVPKTSTGSYKAFEIGAAGNLSAVVSGVGTTLNSNTFVAAGAIQTYAVTGAAATYELGSGTHAWFTAPSGTAGNPISFTQAMTLDASGALGIGTAAPSSTLHVVAVGDNSVIRVGSSTAGRAEWFAQAITGTAITGSLGAYPYAIWTNGAERARIDASGNLLVGVTSASNHTFRKDAPSAYVASVTNVSATAPNGLIIETGGTSAAGGYFLDCYNQSGMQMRVASTGNVVNTNNSYGAISDLKLKENITDASPKLAKLMQVRIVNYNLKADPDKTKLIGVVAQELEKVSPGLIEETADRDAEGNDLGTTTKSVKYSVFVPMLIKSLQEQQAQIEALEARLAAAGI